MNTKVATNVIGILYVPNFCEGGLKGNCVLLQKLGVVELLLLLASSDGNFTKRSHFL